MKSLQDCILNEGFMLTELSDALFDYIMTLNNEKAVDIFKLMLRDTVEYAAEMHPDQEAVGTALEKLAKKLK